MDNNYYTGATLIRGSHSHHHHNSAHGHYSPSLPPNAGSAPNPSSMAGPNNGTSLAGPPLLMQLRNNKNIFSGAPLIRNGSLNNGSVVSVPSNALPTQLHTPSQPGVICCFQPVYYVPLMQNPGMHGPQLALPPPPMKKLNQTPMPKRRNYKSLQISKSSAGPPGETSASPPTPVMSSAPAVLPPNTSTHSKPTPPPPSSAPVMSSNPVVIPSAPMIPSTLNKSSRYPQSQCHLGTSDLSAPVKSTFTSVASQERNSSPMDNMFCNNGEENELNFQSVIESTRYLINNEEKQRSDKLLNFYFYDEHWRPRESEPSLSSSSQLSSPSSTSGGINYGTNYSRRMSCQDIENDWIGHIQHHNHLNVDTHNGFPNYTSHSSNTRLDVDETTVRIRQGQGLSEPKSNNNALSASAMVIKKKDLEVEAQIVTLANGHRDLEIHLCYVTS